MEEEQICSIVDILETSFSRNQDKIAIIENGKKYTYIDLKKMSDVATKRIINENLERKEICFIYRQMR